MHVVVLVKQVPHHDQTPRLDEDGRLIRDGVPTELNPFCRRAVAQAVRLARLSGGTCTAVTMGPDGAADVLREARACGVDHAVHVSDPALAGADCLATARALAAALGTLAPADLILTGRSSIDADTAVVGPMVAALLDRPFAGPALRIEPTGPGTALALTLQHDDATEEVEVSLPAVVAVAERSIAPAKAAPHEWPAPDGIGRIDTATLGEGPWGERGSGTVVHAVRAEARTRTPRRLAGPPEQQAVRAVDLLLERGALAADDPAVAPARPVPADLDGPAVLTLLDATRTPRARYALLDAAAGLAARVGGHVVAAGWPDDPITLREHGADAMLTWESGDARPLCAALAPAAARAWAVLAPATPWGREVLARLAVRLPAGLIADAVTLDLLADPVLGPRLVGTKPAGHGAVADVICRTPIQLATLRVAGGPPRAARPSRAPIAERRLTVAPDPALLRVERRTEDDDTALDQAATIVGVGRGVDPVDYPHLEPLRRLLGAELAATRPVTDAGWLPHGRQVGVTARAVAPRLYLALGLAGSGNHLAGVARAGTILAVNSDPDAPVLTAADIALVGDWRLVVPALVAELRGRGLGTLDS